MNTYEVPLSYAALSYSAVSDSVTPWTLAHQAPLSMGILQARILEWVAMPSSRGSSQPRNQTGVSCITGGFFISRAIKEDHEVPLRVRKFLKHQ